MMTDLSMNGICPSDMYWWLVYAINHDILVCALHACGLLSQDC